MTSEPTRLRRAARPANERGAGSRAPAARDAIVLPDLRVGLVVTAPLAGVELAGGHLLEELLELLPLVVGDGLVDQLHGALGVALGHEHVAGSGADGAQVREDVGQHLGAAHLRHEALLLEERGHHLGESHGGGHVDDRPAVAVQDQGLALHAVLLGSRARARGSGRASAAGRSWSHHTRFHRRPPAHPYTRRRCPLRTRPPSAARGRPRPGTARAAATATCWPRPARRAAWRDATSPTRRSACRGGRRWPTCRASGSASPGARRPCWAWPRCWRRARAPRWESPSWRSRW